MMIEAILKDYAISTIAVSLLGLFLSMSGISSAVLLLYAPILSILNRLYLRRERSMTSLMIFDSIFFASAAVLFFFISGELSPIERLVSVPLLIALSAYSIKDSIKEPEDYSILRLFDFTLISFLLIFGYSSFYGNLDKPIIFIQLSGIATALFALIIERAGGIKKLRPSTIVIMLITYGLIMLLSHYASILGDGAIYLGNLIMALGFLFYRFFDWLFSLIPKFPPVLNSSYIPNASDNRYRSPDILTSTISDNTFKIIIITVLSIIALIILMLVLRKVRIKHRKDEKERNVSSIRSISFTAAVRSAFNALMSMISRHRFIQRNRNNSIGLALWIEMKLHRDSRKKRDGECYYSFLIRLSEDDGYEELRNAAEDINICLYSDEKKAPAVISSAKSIRAGLRHQILSDWVDSHMRLRRKQNQEEPMQ